MRLRHSLRWRVQLAQLVLLGLVVGVLVSGFYVYERRHRLEQVDLELSLPESVLVASHIAIPQSNRTGDKSRKSSGKPSRRDKGTGDKPTAPRMEGPLFKAKVNPAADGENEQPRIKSRRRAREIELLDHNKMYAAVWGGGGELLFAHGFEAGLSPELPVDLLDQEGRNYRWNGDNREMVFIGRHGEAVVIGKSGLVIAKDLANFGQIMLLVGVGILLLGAAIGWYSSGQVLRPIDEISATARRIAEGDLHERINQGDTDDELNELVRVLNTTFARLSESLERQIKFSVDASHELRTPLAIILNECQWALDRSRELPDYKASIAVCEKTARHMRGLIEALLELSRIDATASPLRKKNLSVPVLFDDARLLLEGLAARSGVQLEMQAIDVNIRVDPGKIKQVLINLVNNAVQHSPVGGTVTVAARQGLDMVAIDVIDEGEGIAAADQSRIFDRFYRVDKARSRLQGGSGLGLAISRVIVRTHGGDIKVISVEGKGSRFSVELPREETPSAARSTVELANAQSSEVLEPSKFNEANDWQLNASLNRNVRKFPLSRHEQETKD